MTVFTDYKNRYIRFTEERIMHMEKSHPEMLNQIEKIKETLSSPDCTIESKTDPNVELFYKFYTSTPVNAKYLCVVVKIKDDDIFIITAYFTVTIKKGILLWKKK